MSMCLWHTRHTTICFHVCHPHIVYSSLLCPTDNPQGCRVFCCWFSWSLVLFFWGGQINLCPENHNPQGGFIQKLIFSGVLGVLMLRADSACTVLQRLQTFIINKTIACKDVQMKKTNLKANITPIDVKILSLFQLSLTPLNI